MTTETQLSVTNIEEMGSVYWMRINDRYDLRFDAQHDGSVAIKVYSREDSLNGSGRYWPLGDVTDFLFLDASRYPADDSNLTIREVK